MTCATSRCGSRRPWLLLFVFCLVMLLTDRHATAQPLTTVVLVERGSAALARKIRAELVYAGFLLVNASAAADVASRRRLGDNTATATVVVSADDRVSLYVTSERGPFSEVLVRRPGEAESFPLRVVEQLRARLVDLGLLLPPATPGTEPPRVIDATRGAPPRATTTLPGADRGRLLWLGAGVAATLAVGGFGATPQGLVGLRFEPGAWGVGVLALLPLAENEIANPLGEAEISVNAFALEIDYFAHLTNAWGFRGGLGAGILLLPMQSAAEAPLVAREDTLTAGLYLLDLSVERRIQGWLRIKLSLLAGFASPRPVVRFGGEEVARWGRWFGTLALSGELGLPFGGGSR